MSNVLIAIPFSDLAKRQLDDILFYIYATLGNEVAAARVLEDAENTIQKLAQIGLLVLAALVLSSGNL